MRRWLAIAVMFAGLALAAASWRADAATAYSFRTLRRTPPTLTAVAPVIPGTTLRFAVDGSDAGMTGECANANITGTLAETLTESRASAQGCMKASGVEVTLSNAIPAIEFTPDGGLGVYVESSATNRALRSRDMSNAAWTKSSMTCAATATGIDGAANAASTCTATGANATALQAITVASASRSTSVFIKRRTGTGTISITRDNGSTWIDVTASVSAGAYFRMTNVDFSGLTTTTANPTIGLKISTNTDAVDVDGWQDENTFAATAYATRVIFTTSANVTRAAQAFLWTWTLAANTDFTVSEDYCVTNSANGSTAFTVGTSALDLAKLGWNGSTGWVATCKVGDAAGSAIADTLAIGWCRHFKMHWSNNIKRLDTEVFNGSTSLGTSSCTSATAITTADRIWWGGAMASGQVFLGANIRNGCIDNGNGVCP